MFSPMFFCSATSRMSSGGESNHIPELEADEQPLAQELHQDEGGGTCDTTAFFDLFQPQIWGRTFFSGTSDLAPDT